jgi:tRNA pseudouridine38-40 synthase
MERRTYALLLAYGGGPFGGWQRQAGRPTIQAALEGALAGLGVVASLVAAARTDAGVHARRQVVSFRVRQQLSPAELLAALRSALPRSLRILRWVEAPPSFHARASVQSREYRYRISIGPAPAVPVRPAVGWRLPDPRSIPRSEIDLDAVRAFLREQLGTQDRRRFTTRPVPGRNLETQLLAAGIRERGGSRGYELRFVGDRFTRHLVRNWVGAAMTVGTGGTLPVGTDSWHGVRAPGQGLILWEVVLDPDPFRSGTGLPPGDRGW